MNVLQFASKVEARLDVLEGGDGGRRYDVSYRARTASTGSVYLTITASDEDGIDVRETVVRISDHAPNMDGTRNHADVLIDVNRDTPAQAVRYACASLGIKPVYVVWRVVGIERGFETQAEALGAAMRLPSVDWARREKGDAFAKRIAAAAVYRVNL